MHQFCPNNSLKIDLILPIVLGLQGMGGGNSAASVAANAANLMQFSPLIYSYQLQMAHQALGKKSCKYSIRQSLNSFHIHSSILSITASSKNNMANNANMNDIQRFAEMQRQYFLDLQHQPQPNSSNSRQNNWKS